MVVENDNISKILLNKACFTYFVQFYPLNKLRYRRISDEALRVAERIAAHHKSRIFRPWDEQISRPINQIFDSVHKFCVGSFLICDNMDAAAEISGHREVQATVVTLSGEVFEPTGEVAGGYRGDSISPAKKWYIYQSIMSERKKKGENDSERIDIEEKLQKYNNQREDLQQQKAKMGMIAEKLDRVRGRLQDLKGKLTLDSNSKYSNQVPIYEKKLMEDRKEYSRIETEIKSVEEMLKQIDKGKDVKTMFKDKIRELEEEEKKLKREYTQLNSSYAEYEALISTEQTEIEKIKKHIKEEESKIESLSIIVEERSKYYSAEITNLEVKQKELEDLKIKVNEVEERDEALRQQNEELNEKIKGADDEINSISTQIKNLTGDIADANSKLAKNPELRDLPFVEDRELENVDIKRKEIEQKGIANKLYDLQRQVNKEAESIRGRLEEQMQELIKKEKILKEDKDQIYMNLDQLDEKSQESVLECFKFVNV